MKNTLLLKLAVFCATTLAAFAAERPVPEVSAGGLQVSLSTSGYKFTAADPVVQPATAKTREGLASRDSFAASALLVNRSASDVGFVFPNPAAAERHWTFRVFDSAGDLIWESDADVIAAQVMTEAKLGKSARWKRNILVPLKRDGQWLAPGSYTLEASIDADRQLGATAIFQILPPPSPKPPVGATGIQGQVRIGPVSPVAVAGESNEAPLAGAPVRVEEILAAGVINERPAFSWMGVTDREGRFKVVGMPPGIFRVTASNHIVVIAKPRPEPILLAALGMPMQLGPIVAPEPPKTAGGTASAEVRVVVGRLSEVVLHIDSGIR